MFYAHQETGVNLAQKMGNERAITFSHVVHYTNGWCNLLGEKIRIVQQLENAKAAIFQHNQSPQ